VLAGRVSARIAKDTSFSLGIRQAAASQVAVLQRLDSGNFLTATNARLESGFQRRASSSLAVRHEISGFGLTASAETGDAQLFERAGAEFGISGYNRYGYSGFGLALDREIGPAKLVLAASWLGEDETVLGARFTRALGQNGAQSLFVDGSAAVDLAPGWAISANWRQGWTRANRSEIVTSGSRLTSNAFSFDIMRDNAFGLGDRMAFRISQPLRVTSGGLALNLPVAFDYASNSASFGIRRFNLAPRGREIASEFAWMIPLTSGTFSTNFFWRQEPGHFQNAPDDLGVAFRLNLEF